MTDPGKVHYLFIIDRSGSMHAIREDTQGGIRAFVGKQLEGIKDPGTRTISLHQFDTEHDEVLDFDPLEKAKTYELLPRGGTALLDACGFAITSVGKKLARMPEHERPGHVMVVIATDGQENSSREYTRARVKDMIRHQQDKYNWRFTYIGANQDAFAEAASIGIPMTSTLNYATASTGDTYDVLAASVSAGTVSTTSRITYSSAQRDRAMGK